MRRARPQIIALPPLPPLDEPDELPIVAPIPAAERLAAPGGAQVGDDRTPTPRAPVRTADLRPLAQWERTAKIATVLHRADAQARELLAGSVYPVAAYDRFRRDHAVRPPPGPLPSAEDVRVIVDASVAAPFLIRETLRSLQDQSVGDWHALVVAPAETRAHPIGSFADVDPRIRFVDPTDFAAPACPGLLLTAGTALDPQALAWLLFAAKRTGAGLVFGDHDHGVHDPELGALRDDPWFFAALDRASLGWLPAPAALLATPDRLAGVVPVLDGSEAWRRAVLERGAHGIAAHVPRQIATLMELPIRARGGHETIGDTAPGRMGPVAALVAPPEPVPCDARIAVIIPTRDGAHLLERAVDSLRRTARDPARLDIVIVDNRSTEAETALLLDRFEGEGAARRHPFDKPFNWGLANNEGAAASDASVIVFANNDIEMLAKGWDDLVVDALAAEGVGAVGARLLYPNATVQHGGIVFGMIEGQTDHEGRGVAASDPGPNRRLVTPRSVGAVTGAFLAVTRDTFDVVGGIDTTMAVAHSDIDFCFRLRERGLTIRYEPRIEAIHFESVTRGYNSSKLDVAWDESERFDLVRRWGTSTLEDVGVNPYWARSDVPFDTLREPSMPEIVRHIDRTARAQPWAPSRVEAQEEARWRPEALG
jgi:GT2 family glycosyltransferase